MCSHFTIYEHGKKFSNIGSDFCPLFWLTKTKIHIVIRHICMITDVAYIGAPGVFFGSGENGYFFQGAGEHWSLFSWI